MSDSACYCGPFIGFLHYIGLQNEGDEYFIKGLSTEFHRYNSHLSVMGEYDDPLYAELIEDYLYSRKLPPIRHTQ